MHGGVMRQGVRVARKIGDLVAVCVLALHVVVGDDGIERHGTEQRGAYAWTGKVRVVDRKKVPLILVVSSAFVDVVAAIHHEVRMLLIRVIGDRAVADVSVGVIPERNEADVPAAGLAGGEIALGEDEPVPVDTVEVFVGQLQVVGGRRPVQPSLAFSTVAGESWLRLAANDPAVLIGRSEVDGEVRRALERLPGDDHRFATISQGAARARLNVGKDREEGKARAFGGGRCGEQAIADRNNRQRGDAAGGTQKISATEHSDKGGRSS